MLDLKHRDSHADRTSAAEFRCPGDPNHQAAGHGTTFPSAQTAVRALRATGYSKHDDQALLVVDQVDDPKVTDTQPPEWRIDQAG